MIPAPKHLSEAAQVAWAEITEAMSAQTADGLERAGLEAYCTAVARLRDAQGRIDREGVIISDAKSNPVPHPALAVERAAAAEIRLWLAHYRRFVHITTRVV